MTKWVGLLLIVSAGLVFSAAQDVNHPVPVGGDITAPKRVRFVQPVYPPQALEQGIQSLVVLELTVDERGNVITVRPLRGPSILTSAASKAALQWQYEPTLVGGNPVALRFATTVQFVLPEKNPVPPAPGAYGGNGMFMRPPAPGATSESYEDWTVEGEAFTCCPCDTPCPCRSNAPPSHPPCHATTAQRFSKGHYGDVDLSGALYVTLGPETWTAVYFDESMTPAQRQAILDIYSSMAPGAPQVYRSVQTVPVRYDVSPDGALKRVVIPEILEMVSRARLDPLGRLIGTVMGMDVWSNTIAYGETRTYRYHDPSLGESWDHSGRQSNHKMFTTTKAMFEQRQMLIQHGDGSGEWTANQKRLIACAAK